MDTYAEGKVAHKSYRRWIAAACWALVACTVKQGLDSTNGAGSGPAGIVAGAGSSGRNNTSAGGASSHSHASGASNGSSAGEAGENASGRGGSQGVGPSGAGFGDPGTQEAGAAGAAGAGTDGPPSECELDGGTCTADPNPTCAESIAKCTVTDPGFSCEFPEFAGASANVACGATASVGTACCGGCGCVNVVVHYDGKYCWEGIPDCSLAEYSGKLFYPQAPDH